MGAPARGVCPGAWTAACPLASVPTDHLPIRRSGRKSETSGRVAPRGFSTTSKSRSPLCRVPNSQTSRSTSYLRLDLPSQLRSYPVRGSSNRGHHCKRHSDGEAGVGSHTAFTCHVSSVAFDLEKSLNLSLSFMTLIFLRIRGPLFCLCLCFKFVIVPSY